MYKIKEFSNITKTTIATLRYYDSIGLFKPSYIDSFSGYRYYEDNQIKIIKKINILKDLGLSLEEIKEYIKTNDEFILLNKLKGYEEKMREIEDYMSDTHDIYEVFEGDFNKFILFNGELNSNNPRALEVKDKNNKYYYIKKNGTIYADFTIVPEKDNWITLLNRHNFKNENLMKAVSIKLKEDGYKVISEICPIEMDDVIKSIKKQFKTESDIVIQDGYKYEHIKMYLE